MTKQTLCKIHNVPKKESVDFSGKDILVCPICDEIKKTEMDFKAREGSRKNKIESLKKEITEIQEFATRDKKAVDEKIKKLDKPKEEVKQ